MELYSSLKNLFFPVIYPVAWLSCHFMVTSLMDGQRLPADPFAFPILEISQPITGLTFTNVIGSIHIVSSYRSSAIEFDSKRCCLFSIWYSMIHLIHSFHSYVTRTCFLTFDVNETTEIWTSNKLERDKLFSYQFIILLKYHTLA